MISFDGVYVAQSVGAEDAAVGYDYVRFFSNGAVVTVSAPDAIESTWVDQNGPHSAKGRYAITGRAISFTARSAYGSVEYSGTIENDAIRLRWRSRINGKEGGGLYALAPLPTR